MLEICNLLWWVTKFMRKLTKKGIFIDFNSSYCSNKEEILNSKIFSAEDSKQVILDINVALLTGSTKKSERDVIDNGLRNGSINFIIGTHALIEENVADSPLKTEVLELYEVFTRIMPGNPAPLSTLKDAEGKEYTFADFKDKVLVIDVWATWCHSCLANMHKFAGMRQWFMKEDDVRFITVSIDRSEDKEVWMEALKKHNMRGMLNLFPDCEAQSQFETDFMISGVPRYIIIGKKGEIVSAHAPTPGPEMAAMIERARFAEFYTGPGTNFQNITFIILPIRRKT